MKKSKFVGKMQDLLEKKLETMGLEEEITHSYEKKNGVPFLVLEATIDNGTRQICSSINMLEAYNRHEILEDDLKTIFEEDVMPLVEEKINALDEYNRTASLEAEEAEDEDYDEDDPDYDEEEETSEEADYEDEEEEEYEEDNLEELDFDNYDEEDAEEESDERGINQTSYEKLPFDNEDFVENVEMAVSGICGLRISPIVRQETGATYTYVFDPANLVPYAPRINLSAVERDILTPTKMVTYEEIAERINAAYQRAMDHYREMEATVKGARRQDISDMEME